MFLFLFILLWFYLMWLLFYNLSEQDEDFEEVLAVSYTWTVCTGESW